MTQKADTIAARTGALRRAAGRAYQRVVAAASAITIGGVPKRPIEGDPVWWAPKQVGCVVTEILRHDDGSVLVTFQGGGITRNNRGREIPLWTTTVNLKWMAWSRSAQMWMVGAGPRPTVQGGIIVLPDPVALSGQSRGSFANG